MAQSLGSLVVSLGLNAAEFTSGLTKAERDARLFGQTLNRAITTGATVAGAALVALGGVAVTAFAAVSLLARQAGNFQDLAEKTGANAEALAGYAVALNVTGKSAEDLGDFLVKMSKNLVGVEDGTDKAGAAIQALGLDIQKFKALKPEEQIDALAVALGKFSDVGGGKAAAIESIAKGSAALLPFLKELNEAGGRQNILTADQIKLADAYSDAQARAKAELNLYAQVVATKMLPSIIALTGAAKEFIKDLINVGNQTSTLSGNDAIETWADKSANAVGFLVDAVDAVGRAFQITGTLYAAQIAAMTAIASGELSRVVSIAKDAKKEVDDILARELFSTKLEREIANRKPPTATPDRPDLKFGGAKSPAIDGTKQVLDGQLKALEQAISRERDALAARADFLKDYFSEGLLSVADYYAKLQAARNEEVNNIIKFYDQQIAVQQQFRARAKDAAGQQDATNKIADIQEKQNKLTRDAITAEEKLKRERSRAIEEYIDQIEEINAKLFEMAGNTAAATSIRFDQQTRGLRNVLQSSRDVVGQEGVARLKDQADKQAKLNDETAKYSFIIQDIANAQARVDLLAQTGALTEIEAINKRADLARKYVDELRRMADAQAILAAGLAPGPAQEAALQNVARMRLEIDALASATDVLAKKFNDIGADATATLFTDLINKPREAKQAFLDYAKTIEQQISRIASKNLADALFKTDGGAFGGFGKALSDLFGTKSAVKEPVGIATVSGVGADAVITSLGNAAGAAELALGTFTPTVGTSELALSTFAPSVSAADGGLVTLYGSLTLASDAALTFAASAAKSAAASTVGSAFGGGGTKEDFLLMLAEMGLSAFAKGGDPPIGKMSIVGERGPELFIPKVAGTIIPATASAEIMSRVFTGDKSSAPLRSNMADAAIAATLGFVNAATNVIASLTKAFSNVAKMLGTVGLGDAAKSLQRVVNKPLLEVSSGLFATQKHAQIERNARYVVPVITKPYSAASFVPQRLVEQHKRVSEGVIKPFIVSGNVVKVERSIVRKFTYADEVIPVRQAVRAYDAKRYVSPITAQPYKASHFVTVPPRLIEQRIIAHVGNVVRDTVVGSSVAAKIAQSFGRKFTYADAVAPVAVRRQATITSDAVKRISNIDFVPAKQFQRIAAMVQSRQDSSQSAAVVAKSALTLAAPFIVASKNAARVFESVRPSIVVNNQHVISAQKHFPAIGNVEKLGRNPTTTPNLKDNSLVDAIKFWSLLTKREIQGFATGGNPPLNRPSLIGEDGPELWVPRSAGTVVPLDEFRNSRSSGRVNNNITVNVLPGATRASADQAAAAMARELRRASVREF